MHRRQCGAASPWAAAWLRHFDVDSHAGFCSYFVLISIPLKRVDMSTTAAPETANDDPVDAAIAACGGDLRETIAALLADNAALSKELDFATLAHSFGYSRGWFARKRAARQPPE